MFDSQGVMVGVSASEGFLPLGEISVASVGFNHAKEFKQSVDRLSMFDSRGAVACVSAGDVSFPPGEIVFHACVAVAALPTPAEGPVYEVAVRSTVVAGICGADVWVVSTKCSSALRCRRTPQVPCLLAALVRAFRLFYASIAAAALPTPAEGPEYEVWVRSLVPRGAVHRTRVAGPFRMHFSWFLTFHGGLCMYRHEI